MLVEESLKLKIEEALESIRPYLKKDGGDVRLVSLTEEGVVEIELLGACSACNLSPMTMKSGVEQAIKKVAPEVKAVIAINFQ